ncbi:hypothetical protein ONK27_27865, partial [Salmonella enterica subsp. enterica serovar Virginia]|nr:hypothetical protein [Salmonella enterica subsp. enterica serovar Virginia]
QPLLGLAIHDSLQEDNDLESILTAKEREIVGMVCEGASNKLISTLLSSPSPAITTAPVVKIKEHTESKPDMKSFVSKDGEKVPL